MHYSFGIDIGGTTIKIGLLNDLGELICKTEIPTRKENHGELLISDIAEKVNVIAADYSIPFECVSGVGLAVPGIVLADGTVKACVNLDGWSGDVAGSLSSVLHNIPVKVLNDANAATLGEYYYGSAQGTKNMIFVTLGTGVGGGIVVDGRLLVGGNGACGEIGHIKVAEPDDDICGCGKSGCLERYASATGIVLRTKKLLASTETNSSLRNIADLTCKDIFDCAHAGDTLAIEAVDTAAKTLGKALANVACVCDPEVIIIGGGVSKAGDILVEPVQKYFTEYALFVSENVKIKLAMLGNDAGMYGAAGTVLD